MRESIDDLLQTGAIVECQSPPTVVNPLTVAKKGGKMRLVLDLRHINKKLVLTKYKYEGNDTLLQYVKKGGYLT